MGFRLGECSRHNVTLMVEGSYATSTGGSLGINQLSGHRCRIGTSVLYRLRASALLPFVKEVEIAVKDIERERVAVRVRLPRGWRLRIEDILAESETFEGRD